MKRLVATALISYLIFVQACLSDETSHTHRKDAFQPTTSTKSDKLDRDKTNLLKLYALIATHPDPQLREELDPLVQNGLIKTSFDHANNSAFFAIIRPENAPRAPLVPVLSIDPALLQDSRRTQYVQMVIYHEYIHFLQWSQGHFPETLFYIMHPNEIPNPEEWCEQKWYAEQEAYQKECGFARKIGAEKTLLICTEKGDLDHDRLKSFMMQDKASADICKSVWRKL